MVGLFNFVFSSPAKIVSMIEFSLFINGKKLK
jgi:hypothetical protein